VVSLSVGILGVCVAPVAHADVTQQKSCVSGPTWTVKAAWGERYTDFKGASRIRVAVQWTAAAGPTVTDWEVRSHNGDGTVAETLAKRETFPYGGKWASVNARDPLGSAPFVTVKLGVADDGRTDCSVTFTPPGLLFSDDSNGPSGQSFDRSKWQDWSSCSYHASAAYGNIKCGATETLDGQGHLRIPATPTTGASLSTATKFGFVYGEMSAWIKNPAADGYWPALWTLNAEPECCLAKTLPVGEIDVMEGYTTWDDLYHRGVHNWNDSLTWTSNDAVCGNVDLTAAYHKYTVRVEPEKMIFFFDGKQCGTTFTKGYGGGKPYAFGPDVLDPNFIILTLAVGGADGQQNPATQPAIMLVDRVEVRGL